MVGTTSDWKDELGLWLKPFLDRLDHKTRRRMRPLYVSGLIGPGDRKSIQPMAERLTLGAYDQLHHFVASGVWGATPVETELLVQAVGSLESAAEKYMAQLRHNMWVMVSPRKLLHCRLSLQAGKLLLSPGSSYSTRLDKALS